MPIYCYANKDGQVLEEVFPIGQAPSTIVRSGKRYGRALGVEHAGFRNTPGNWPKVTVMAGVQPQQAGELAAFCLSHPDPRVRGVEVRADGQVKVADRKQYNAYLKARGMCHKNAGYGDVAPSKW